MKILHRIQWVWSQHNRNGSKLQRFLNAVGIMSLAFGASHLLGFTKQVLKIKACRCHLKHCTRILLQSIFAGLTKRRVRSYGKCGIDIKGSFQGFSGMFWKKVDTPVSKSNRNRRDHWIFNYAIDALNMQCLGTQPFQTLAIKLTIGVLANQYKLLSDSQHELRCEIFDKVQIQKDPISMTSYNLGEWGALASISGTAVPSALEC